MSLIKLGDCQGEDCGRTNVPIINRRRMLCDRCNTVRLNPTSDITFAPVRKRKSINKLSEKTINEIKLDEEFYEEVWNSKPHFCEECDEFLGDEFRDDNGKVINKFRYSHILPKGGQYGEFRRRINNCNLLCLNDHNKWEHGIQTDMKIYKKNKEAIDLMLNELIVKNGRRIEG